MWPDISFLLGNSCNFHNFSTNPNPLPWGLNTQPFRAAGPEAREFFVSYEGAGGPTARGPMVPGRFGSFLLLRISLLGLWRDWFFFTKPFFFLDFLWKVFPPPLTAIALGSSAIVTVSGQNCFRILYVFFLGGVLLLERFFSPKKFFFFFGFSLEEVVQIVVFFLLLHFWSSMMMIMMMKDEGSRMNDEWWRMM